MISTRGRLRQMSTQTPAGKLINRRLEIRINASRRPKISERTIPIAAISRLIRKPSTRNLKLFPVHTHSQLSGSKRYVTARSSSPDRVAMLEVAEDQGRRPGQQQEAPPHGPRVAEPE